MKELDLLWTASWRKPLHPGKLSLVTDSQCRERRDCYKRSMRERSACCANKDSIRWGWWSSWPLWYKRQHHIHIHRRRESAAINGSWGRHLGHTHGPAHRSFAIETASIGLLPCKKKNQSPVRPLRHWRTALYRALPIKTQNKTRHDIAADTTATTSTAEKGAYAAWTKTASDENDGIHGHSGTSTLSRCGLLICITMHGL